MNLGPCFCSAISCAFHSRNLSHGRKNTKMFASATYCYAISSTEEQSQC
jgi:hypothetical protein